MPWSGRHEAAPDGQDRTDCPYGESHLRHPSEQDCRRYSRPMVALRPRPVDVHPLSWAASPRASGWVSRSGGGQHLDRLRGSGGPPASVVGTHSAEVTA